MDYAEMRLKQIEQKIIEIQSQINMEEKELNEMHKLFKVGEYELEIQCSLIQSLEFKLTNLLDEKHNLMELKAYQAFCNHEYVEDLIDINLDSSKSVVYCKYCHLCK